MSPSPEGVTGIVAVAKATRRAPGVVVVATAVIPAANHSSPPSEPRHPNEGGKRRA